MSYVPKERLRGTQDPNISFYTTERAFTTSQLITDCVSLFAGYAKAFRIVNKDGTNQLTYRQGSTSGILKPVPPNSEVVVVGWESYIEINPDAVTGSGFLEIDLVNIPDAYAK